MPRTTTTSTAPARFGDWTHYTRERSFTDGIRASLIASDENPDDYDTDAIADAYHAAITRNLPSRVTFNRTDGYFYADQNADPDHIVDAIDDTLQHVDFWAIAAAYQHTTPYPVNAVAATLPAMDAVRAITHHMDRLHAALAELDHARAAAAAALRNELGGVSQLGRALNIPRYAAVRYLTPAVTR